MRKLKRQLKVLSSCKLRIHQCFSVVQRLICILSLLWNLILESSSRCSIYFSLKTSRDVLKDTNTFIDIYYYLRFWGHNFCVVIHVRFLRSNELCTCKKVQCLPFLVIFDSSICHDCLTDNLQFNRFFGDKHKWMSPHVNKLGHYNLSIVTSALEILPQHNLFSEYGPDCQFWPLFVVILFQCTSPKERWTNEFMVVVIFVVF